MAINLLPWRLQQHRQQSRRLVWRIVLWLLCTGVGYGGLQQFTMQLTQQLSQQQALFQQQQAELNKLHEQINKLRTSYHTPQTPLTLSAEHVHQALGLISGLPFQQGELAELSLNAEQLMLTGQAVSQAEFESLHQYLQQNALFPHIQLREFKPLQNTQLLFQFELSRENKNE